MKSKKRLLSSLLVASSFMLSGGVALSTPSFNSKAAAVTNIPCTDNQVTYYLDGPSSITINNIKNLESEVNSKYKIKKQTTKCVGGFLESLMDATTTTVNGTISVSQTSGTSYRISYQDAYKDITVNVIPDESAPVLATTLDSTGVVTNVNNPITSDSLLLTFTAVDAIDGGVEVYYKEDSGQNYDNNRFIVGTYTLIVGAKDSSNNEATYTFDVIVKDNDAPIIEGPSSYTSKLSDPLNESTIKSKLTISDNYDHDINLVLKNDGFTGNELKVGTYSIVYSATDSSGNVAEDKVITIYVVDDVPPTLNVKNKEITVSASKYLSLEETIMDVSANDNVDGDLTTSITLIEDTYEANRYFLGTYKRVIQVTDVAGNITEETIRIHVVDLDAPVLYVQNKLLVDGLILTEDVLADIIAQVSNIEYTTYSFRKNDYSANSNISGTYLTSIAYTLEDGTDTVVDTSIIVSENIETTDNKDKNTDNHDSSIIKKQCIYGSIMLVGIIVLIRLLSKKDKHGGKRR